MHSLRIALALAALMAVTSAHAEERCFPRLGETTVVYEARCIGDAASRQRLSDKQAADEHEQKLAAEQQRTQALRDLANAVSGPRSYSYWYSYSSAPRDECAGHPIPRLCRLGR